MMRRHAAVALIAAAGVLPSVGLAAEAPPAAQAGMKPAIQEGSTVQIDYTLTVEGKMVDSSQGRQPLKYVQGHQQIIPGLERQLAGLHVGDTGTFTVRPEEGYGPIHQEAFVDIPLAQLPKGANPAVGMTLRGTDKNGDPFQARIHKINGDNVTLDLNHPLAGKTLEFTVKVVSITS